MVFFFFSLAAVVQQCGTARSEAAGMGVSDSTAMGTWSDVGVDVDVDVGGRN